METHIKIHVKNFLPWIKLLWMCFSGLMKLKSYLRINTHAEIVIHNI